MCMFTASKCINSRCSCARHQMGLFLIANWIIWLIQTWKFDVLLNCQHSNMLLLCMLHIKSTVSCFILEVTNYEPLVYHNLLVC